MKRSLSLILVLCMLLAACFAFSSCGKVTPKDVEKNAQATMSEAMDNTTSEFFGDDIGLKEMVKSALKSGSVTLAFEGKENDIGLDLNVSETLYCNAKDKEYVSDTTVTFDGETLNALVYVDKNGVALNSPSVLGSNKTLLLNPATLASGLEGSFLSEMLFGGDRSDEDMDQIVSLLGTINNEYQKFFDKDAKENREEELNEIYALLGQTVAKESIDDVDCVAITYTITNSTVKAVADKLLADMELDAEMKEELKTEFDEAIEELNENATLNLTVKICIGQKSNKVEKITVGGTVVILEDQPETIEINAELVFGETEIKLTGSILSPDLKGNADVTLKKETKGDNIVYSLVVNAGDGKGASVNALNVTYTYNKGNGAFVLAADVYSDGDERVGASVNGTVTVNKDNAKLEITSVTVDGETVNFKLSAIFNKNASMPKVPEGAKDVVTLTEAEWEEIIEEIEENSKIADLM